MGLVVKSLCNVPHTDRKYFIYLLQCGWGTELDSALMKLFPRMAQEASDSDSVVIAGSDAAHFQNDVFSWHRINGEDASELLPAILLTTVHPERFRNERDPFWLTRKPNEHMVLISLKEFASTPDKVADLIRKLFTDIQHKRDLSDFEVVKTISRHRSRAFMDSIILRPGVAGCSIDIKQALKAIFAGR